MELDDLKQSWQQTNLKNHTNKNIMDLIQHKSYGPVAALKSGFKKQIIVMILVPVMLLLTNVSNITAALTSIMFWTYTAFCLGIIIFSYVSYRIVTKLEAMDGMIKPNLEQQINLLETRLKWKMIAARIALLVFIVLTEVVPYIQHYSMLDKWHSLNPFIRFGAYAALLVIQYFALRANCERRFGKHLTYLKQLVKEMQ